MSSDKAFHSAALILIEPVDRTIVARTTHIFVAMLRDVVGDFSVQIVANTLQMSTSFRDAGYRGHGNEGYDRSYEQLYSIPSMMEPIKSSDQIEKALHYLRNSVRVDPYRVWNGLGRSPRRRLLPPVMSTMS